MRHILLKRQTYSWIPFSVWSAWGARGTSQLPPRCSNGRHTHVRTALHCFGSWGLPGLGEGRAGPRKKEKTHVDTLFHTNAGIFPEAAASARLLVRPGGGPNAGSHGVYGRCVRVVGYCMDWLPYYTRRAYNP